MILLVLGFGLGKENEEAAACVEGDERESGAALTEGDSAPTNAAVVANGSEHANSAPPPSVMTNSTEGDIVCSHI